MWDMRCCHEHNKTKDRAIIRRIAGIESLKKYKY